MVAAHRPVINKPYRWLAKYYDQVLPDRSPLNGAREVILAPVLPSITSVCDLACGTGDTALTFARGGLKVFGVDGSSAMVRAARRKLSVARLPGSILRGDMRDFRLPEPVDLVTCEGDAVNHVYQKSDLTRVAAAVARALRPGGYFYFDVNNRKGFERYWNATWCGEAPGVVMVLRSACDPAQDRAWSDVDWFIREGKCWSRRREHVEEVCWSAAEIRTALKGAGFQTIREFDAAPYFNSEFMQPGCRSMYLARKPVRIPDAH